MRSTIMSIRRSRLVGAVAVAVLIAVAAGVALVQSARATTLATFSTPGYHAWTVPTGVTAVTFDVYGASGGYVVAVHNGVLTVVSSGGAGGEARARFAVHAGEKFVIAVGGRGGSVTEGAHITGAAGVNGGGFGDDDTGCVGCGSLVSGGGGGASDVRIGGRGNACLLSPAAVPCQSYDRIIVAGGGGGGSDANAGGASGFAGGGVTGGGGVAGGAQEFPGAGGRGNQGFWQGASANRGSGIGGGGGGWFGGGSAGAGGGGSGYINRLSTSGSFPGGSNVGDGKVIITT